VTAEREGKGVSRYLDSVVGLFVEDGYIFPAHATDNIDHCFHLIVITGYCAREELETLLVAQLGTRREK